MKKIVATLTLLLTLLLIPSVGGQFVRFVEANPMFFYEFKELTISINSPWVPVALVSVAVAGVVAVAAGVYLKKRKR